jgi:hypothetical protein
MSSDYYLFLFFGFYLTLCQCVTNDFLTVKTQYGLVEGCKIFVFTFVNDFIGFYDSNNTVRAFLGIPFASPPVNQLRWKPPVAPENWTEVRPATQYVKIEV